MLDRNCGGEVSVIVLTFGILVAIGTSAVPPVRLQHHVLLR